MGPVPDRCPHCNAALTLPSPEFGYAKCPSCGNPLPQPGGGRSAARWLWLLPAVLVVAMAGGFFVYMQLGAPPPPSPEAQASFEQSFTQGCNASFIAGFGQGETAETKALAQRYCQCSLDEFNKTLAAKQWSLASLLPDLQGDLSGNPELKAEMTRISEACAKQAMAQ